MKTSSFSPLWTTYFCYYEKNGNKIELIDEIIPFDIPNNWCWCRLSSIATLSSGNVYEQSNPNCLYIKVADMNLLDNLYEITISEHKCYGKSSDIIATPSIIFPKRGGAIATNKKRKVFLTNICVDSNIMALTPILTEIFEYVYLWFSSIDLGKLATGTSVPQINNVDIYPLLIPIPPLEEQIRIIKCVETIFSRIKGEI